MHMKRQTLSLLVLLVASVTTMQAGVRKTKSIKTDFPTKDWVVAECSVTDFGARAVPGFDNREAFQQAITTTYLKGGGVVFVPSGHYEFRSTALGSRKVRMRAGRKETTEEFTYNYVLTLPPGVQLRGDWADPADHDCKVLGTVLEVRVGAGSPACDASVESWWNDPQAGNVLHTTYTSIADRFIELNAGTGVTNLSIWYPEQDINDVKPYPWTLYQTAGDNATIECVTLVNPYNGIYSAPSELHYIHDTYVSALNKGVEIHVCTDIGRIENVNVKPCFWAESGLPGTPDASALRDYMLSHTTGFQMHRSDWEYVSELNVSGCRTGIWIGREPGFDDAPNAQLYSVHVDDCADGLYVDAVNPYGILISNSSFASAEGGRAVRFGEDFATSVQFNGVRFEGPVLSDGRGGVISFENCSFACTNAHSLTFNSGNAILTQCRFDSPDRHVLLGGNMSLLKSLNSGFDGRLAVTNEGKAVAEIVVDDRYKVETMPEGITTDIAVHPRPVSRVVMIADFPRASGFNNDQPTVDISDELQKALDKFGKNGGTLYLPAGRYLVDKPVVVPEGVELRGSWDVPHHTQSGGTAIFTHYDGGPDGPDGVPLIRLGERAGLRGLNIVQMNIISDGCDNMSPRQTPFLIQGMGPKVYAVNVTIPVGDKGLDLATHNTSGHYVDYLGGVLLRAGIWVGGGAEGGYIRNMQLNPHYGTRLPLGGQGYPDAGMMRYVQSHCSALKFADVKGQTIFNNFVYGSIYGIHFLKDSVTGRYPGEMTVIGHGSDGCTFSLFVEDADAATKIVAINSELVNTRIMEQPLRSYVLMGGEAGTPKVDPRAELVLFNSALWGSPITAATVNNGTVRFQQANFTRCGTPGINVAGGSIHVYSSYFAEKMPTEEDIAKLAERREKFLEAARNAPRDQQRRKGRGWNPQMFQDPLPTPETAVYVNIGPGASAVELTNNHYASELKSNGTDIMGGLDAK